VSVRIAVLGLGEAGSAIGAHPVAAGADIRGYDPKPITVDGVQPRGSEAEAVADADLVLSLNSSHDAMTALENALDGLRPGTLFADLNTASPGLKVSLAERVAGRDVEVVDVALMSPVPGRGLRTPMTASGPAAESFAEVLRPYGASVSVLAGPIGSAATHKLLRSVFYKGLAAAVLEATAAARAAGLSDWLRDTIAQELIRADADTLERLLTGSKKHAVRRIHEMEAAGRLLDDLGVPARVTRASRDWLTDLAE